MAIQSNLIIDQGSKFETITTIQNDDGTPYDLTGKTPYAQMRKSYYTSTAINITATVEGDPLNGQIKLTLIPSLTNSIKAGRYVYDVEVHDDVDTENVKRIMQGIITISPNVTKTP